jgi:uncharacterized protein YjbI with pentapeptide repeats
MSQGQNRMDIAAVLTRYAEGVRDFAQLNLQEAELNNLMLSEANFRQADFRQARLGKTNLSHACLQAADLSEAILWGTHLDNADLSGQSCGRQT